MYGFSSLIFDCLNNSTVKIVHSEQRKINTIRSNFKSPIELISMLNSMENALKIKH